MMTGIKIGAKTGARTGAKTGAKTDARTSRSKKRNTASVIFTVLYLLFIFVPLIMVVMWSVVDMWPWPGLLPESFSLRGFSKIFGGNGSFLGTVILTIGIALATSVISVIIATMAARALVLHFFRGREVFRFGTILPFLIPQTVFAMGVQVLFLKIGLANTIAGVIIAHCIIALPYAVSIMVDVTAAAGVKLEEQAKVLGANNLSMVRHVMIPKLLPGLLSAATMSYLLSIGSYFVTLLIGGGQVTTVMLTMFPVLTGSDRTIAGAYALTFLVASLIVFVIFELILKRFGAGEQKDLFT